MKLIDKIIRQYKRVLNNLLAHKEQRTTYKMTTRDLRPPVEVRGMINLDRSKFNQIVEIPTLYVDDSNLNSVLPHLKNHLLKMDRLKPVRSNDNQKSILLNPATVSGWSDIPDVIRDLGLNESALRYEPIEIRYENWKSNDILKAVLPEHQESSTSYSRIGHIIHLNLRDHLSDYKSLIGEVLRDKTVGCKTVVNKIQTIESTYRNFRMELLCGEPDYQVRVKENGVQFEFDFAEVYWNPRLATEHERIVTILKRNDCLYDVFAGVGPFSIPAAKKGCVVLANDLNPMSYKWLEHNVRLNKVGKMIEIFNRDGIDFIKNEIKNDLMRRILSNDLPGTTHITMNLPAKASEFLSAFKGLLNGLNEEKQKELTDDQLPMVHVYCFVKGDNAREAAQQLIETDAGFKLNETSLSIQFVRNVAPNKDMYRVTFRLTLDVLLWKISEKRCSGDTEDTADDAHYNKKHCISIDK